MYVRNLLNQNSYLNHVYQRLLPVMVFILFGTVGVQAQNAYTNAGLSVPTVTSDKADYAPGEVAIITGTGWKLDSLVDIHLEEEPSHDHHHSYHDTKVNADGTWEIRYQIEERHLGVKFTVIADGKKTGYQGLAYFTDALNTVLNVASASGNSGESISISARLIQQQNGAGGNSGVGNGSGVPNMVISFLLNGTSVGTATTDNNGYAILNTSIPNNISPGTYQNGIKAIYTKPQQGDYNSSEGFAQLVVNPACVSPTISNSPTDQIITYGGANPSFSVTASGSFSSYQWQLSTDNGSNWNNINGATAANYTVVNATTAMSGYLYRAVLTGCNTPVTSNAAKLTVNKQPLTIIVNPKTKVYGSANPALDGTVSGLLAADNITVAYSTTAVTTSDVGTYPITAILTDPGNKLGNYTVTNTAANLTVTPAAATITLSELSKIYNGTAQGATVTTSPSGLSVNVTYNGTTTVPTGADTYTVTAAITNSNYTATPVSGSLVISPRPITITADAKTKVYGDNDPALTYTLTAGELVEGDNISGSLNRVAGEAAGSYAIQQNSLSAGSNYSLTYTGANLVISPKAITVTPATGQSKIYGSADPELTYTSTALVGSDSFQGALSRESGDQVGGYNITKGTLALSSNYKLNFTDGIKFNITPKSVTATITASDKVYDGTTTASATGSVPTAAIVPGDVVEVSVNNAHFADKNVGQGKTVTAGVSISNSNYNLSNATASTTANITAKDITGAFTVSDKEYDGTTTATVTGLSLAGVITPDVVQLTGGTAAFADKNAGTGKTVTLAGASLSGADKDNYNLTSVATTTASISRKPAAVTPAAYTKVYGQHDPTLQGTLTGFIAADGITAAYDRAAGENVGNYAIGATLSPIGALSNYTITYNPANFEITKAPLTVTADNKTRIYGDDNPSLTVSYSGLVNNETTSVLTQVPGATTSATKSSGVGNYPITVSGGEAANYSFTYVAGTLTINKADIAVTADNKSKTYGDDNPAFTGTITGIRNGDAITAAYNTTATKLSSAGEYAIVPSLWGGALSNYNTPAITNGILKINKAELIVSADDKSKYCGAENPAFTVQYSGFVNNETASVLGGTLGFTTAANVNSLANSYIVTPGGLTSLNYNITFVPGTLTVLSLSVDASASSNPVQLGSSATLSAIVSEAVAGITVKFYLNDQLKGSALTNGSGNATLSVSGLELGLYKVTAVVGGGCAESIAYLPVYDPNGSFVTGGGWINSPEGALLSDQKATGKANFGFVSKYKKGSNQVDGNTEFQFSAGNMNFKSTLHESGSLVIAGGKATYRGDGTVNGVAGYKFVLTAIDGNWNNGTAPDKFRIKITQNGTVVYDNQMGKEENSADATVLGNDGVGGGSIVIHEVKSTTTNKTTKLTASATEPGTIQFYNYPNTFTDRTTIAFSLDREESYILEVYDMRGALIKKVDMGVAKAGKLYEYEFSGASISKGIYIARLVTPSGARSIKMLLSK